VCRKTTGCFFIILFAIFSSAGLAGATDTQTVSLATGYNYVTCEIVGSGAGAGNDISNPNFLQVDDSLSGIAEMTFWDCTNQNFSTTVYIYLSDNDAGGVGLGGWYDNTLTIRESATWSRGMGAVIYNPVSPAPILLHGTGGLAPSYPSAAYCGCGVFSFLGAQNTNYAASYHDVTGQQPVEGSVVSRYYTNSSQYETYETDTYTGGAWTPNTPILSLNQAALYYVPCATNCITLSMPSNIVMAVCTNARIGFLASATDTCCTNWTVTCSPSSNSIFPIGSTTVSCVVTDVCGNYASNVFTITLVQKNFSVTCPTNKTVTNGYTWSFDLPVVTNCCTNLSVMAQTPVTNGTCPSIISETWIITNACGDSYVCTQLVTNICFTNPCDIIFPADKTNACGSNLVFDVPQVYSPCCFSGSNTPAMSILHTFSGGTNDGATSYGGVIESSDGELYGMATFGGLPYFYGAGLGSGGNPSSGSGVIYRIDKGGANYQILKFLNLNDTTGWQPFGDLMESTNDPNDLYLYGTTEYGGTNGGGVVFRMDKSGIYNVLYSFPGVSGDGSQPDCTLVQGTNGYLFGTTRGGNGSANFGIIFTLDRTGNNYTVLHTMDPGGSEGETPTGGLSVGPDKSMYGVAQTLGAYASGTLFKINQDGSGFQVVHHFNNNIGEGASPMTVPFVDADGTIYGTTSTGGAYGYGTFYKIPPSQPNQLQVLYSFGGTSDSGQQPSGRLAQLCDGSLAGTTQAGGNGGGSGTVYKIGKNGNDFSILYSTSYGNSAGVSPQDGVLFASDGTVYLTTASQTSAGYGALLQLGCPGITNSTSPCCTNAVISTNSTVTNSLCPLTVTRNWSVSTSCGYTTNGSQTITLTNTVSFISVPGATNYGCNTNNLPTDASIKSLVVVSGGCSSNTTVVSHLDWASGCTSIRTFYINVTNACGTIATTNVLYSWAAAAAAPTLLPGYVANKYVGCGSAISFDTPMATDPCTGLVVSGVLYGTVQSNNCPQASFIRTWFFTNSCGNATNFVSQTITVTNAAATFVTLPTGGYLGCSPASLPTVASVNAQISATGCASGTNVTVAADTVTNCVHYRTFTALLTSTCGAVISSNIQYSWTIVSNLPVITTTFTNLTTNICSNYIVLTLNGSATSTCCTNVSVSFYDRNGNLATTQTGVVSTYWTFVPGTNVVTFTASDCCGNTATSHVTVIVMTNPTPVITLATNLFKVCMGSDGCGVLGDYRTWANSSYVIGQSPAAGTRICNNTTLVFTATNSCGIIGTNYATAFLGACCDPPPLNMVLWLTFDETTGTTCFNSANQGNPGSRYVRSSSGGKLVETPVKAANSAPQRVTGEVGNALSFDGSSEVIVPFKGYPGIDFTTGSFSVDLWVKWSGNGPPVQTLLAKESKSGNNVYGYYLYLSSGVPNFVLYSGTTSSFTAESSSPLAVGVWEHLAVTVNRSVPSTQNGFNIYLNGVNKGSSSIGTFPGSIHNTGNLYLGAWPLGTSPTQNSFSGSLDEIEIFNRVLSPTEVAGIANAGMLGKCRPSVSVPNPTKVCPGTKIVQIEIQICNNGADSRGYLTSFAQLSAPQAASDGIANAITWGGISDPIEPYSIQVWPVTPGSCQSLFIQVMIPPNLVPGTCAAYQVSVQDTLTMDTMTALGTIIIDPACISTGGGGNVQSGIPIVVSGSSLTNLTFPIGNASGNPSTYNGQLLVIDNNQQLDTNFVSLNSQPPGTPVNFSVTIPGNDSTNVGVTLGYSQPTLLQPLYLELLLDDGAGGPLTPLDSVPLLNVNPPGVGPVMFVDSTNGQDVISWDAINTGWFLDSTPDLSGTNWSPVALPVGPLPDGSQGVIIQPTNSAQFFRLRQ
jgi:uncharacterized repeat protein (TIGR03803 family)